MVTEGICSHDIDKKNVFFSIVIDQLLTDFGSMAV